MVSSRVLTTRSNSDMGASAEEAWAYAATGAPCRARPHLTYLATRRFVQVLIVTVGRGVVATSRRYAE